MKRQQQRMSKRDTSRHISTCGHLVQMNISIAPDQVKLIVKAKIQMPIMILFMCNLP